jgi:hypothetical protein
MTGPVAGALGSSRQDHPPNRGDRVMTYVWSFRAPSRSVAAVPIGRSIAKIAGLASGLAAACTLLASPAQAIVTTIDFSGTGPYVQGYYYGLTNSLTGTDTLPALPVVSGDIIQGTVSFASAITVLNNSYFASVININETNGAFTDFIYYTAALSYFNGATEVTPAGLGTYAGSTQGLRIGNYQFSGTGGFTFDRIEYSVTFDYFFDDDNQLEIRSGSLPESNSSYYLAAIPTQSPAPEPASWAMMIVGFGMVGAMLRGRRTVGLSFA